MDNPTYIALSGLVAQQRAVEVVAGNLANMSTPGYRAERVLFNDWLLRQHAGAASGEAKLAFTQDRATWRDRGAGTLTHTGNPLDLALGGEGWFTVQTASGPRLTRAGRFTLQSDGSITDGSGNALLDANGQKVQVSPADTELTVSADGALSSQNGPIARIGVVAPSDVNRMTAEGSRLFRADVATAPVATPHVIQGAVEESNVQPIGELVRMLDTERKFQFVSQFVEAESQRHQTAIDRITDASASA
jgi:flagellar basal-body rod protein FlgF